MILTSLLAALTLSLFSSLPLCGSPQTEGVKEESSFRAMPKNAVFNMDDEYLSYTETLHTDDYIEVYIPYGTYKKTNGTEFVLDASYVSSLDNLFFHCGNILSYPRAMDKRDMGTYMRGSYTLSSDTSFINAAMCHVYFAAVQDVQVDIAVSYEDLFKWKDNPVLPLVENSSNPSNIVYNVQVPLTPTDVVNEIVDILVSGLVDFGTGLGTGISTFVTALALNAAGDGLSVYFTLIIVFAAVALSIGLTRLLYNTLTSLGN